MTQIFAIANQKGGVGKTTTTVNLAACLSRLKKKVLLVDLDPQGNATVGCGVDKNSVENTTNELLLKKASLKETLMKKCPGGFDLLPSNSALTEAEVILIKKDNKETRLKEALLTISHKYDYIFLDCPPSLNMLTINALVACDSIIIPMQCEYYALEGLSALLGTMENIRSSLNSKLSLEGIVLTMYDTRNRLAIDVTKQLKEHFGNKVYENPIPRNVRLAEAPSYGVPICMYAPDSAGAHAYNALAKEINAKVSKKIKVDLEQKAKSKFKKNKNIKAKVTKKLEANAKVKMKSRLKNKSKGKVKSIKNVNKNLHKDRKMVKVSPALAVTSATT